MSQIKLSLRPTKEILYLFSKINKFQPTLKRVNILNAAISTALADEPKWSSLSTIEINVPEEVQNQALLQLRVNDKAWETVTENIKKGFTPNLLRVTIPYAVKLLLLNYLQHLESLNKSNKQENEPGIKEDEPVNDVYYIKKFVDMLLNNNNSIEVQMIKKILDNFK